MSEWLIAIQPRFAAAIFSGEKTVELRRRRLHASAGDILFVYETSPIMAIRGSVQVNSVETRSVDRLWRLVGNQSSIRRSEYLRYFEGSNSASGIHIRSPREFVKPLDLSTIRSQSPLFHPPRTWTAFVRLPLPLQVQLRDYWHEAQEVTAKAFPSLSAAR